MSYQFSNDVLDFFLEIVHFFCLYVLQNISPSLAINSNVLTVQAAPKLTLCRAL